MATKRDYYEILGLNKNADDAQVKSAFRKLAKQYHPDVNPGDKNAEAKFKEINEAYEVLGDSQKRSRYDQFGHEDPQGMGGAYSGGFSGFGGVEDIFDAFFGGFGGSSRARGGPQRGADIQAGVTITFEEAAFGVTKDINVSRREVCEECSGSGAKKGTSAITCTNCHGAGQVQINQNTAIGRFSTLRTCDVCGGTGKLIPTPCPTCSGRGQVKRSRTVSVNIPAGIDHGQSINLRGQGEAGQRSGEPGDLYVRVSVRKHTFFERRNYDIYCEIPITYTQATLGGEIEVPTLTGKIRYQVPESTQTGTTFRLKGQGITRLRSASKGDLFVKVNIDVPKRLNSKQKELLRAFEDSLGDDKYEARKSFFDRMKQAFGG